MTEGRKPATLADVARLAGVVPMTASRAINSSGYVGQEVRERVLKAARKLHYRPNILARTLRGQGLQAVGVMLPDSTISNWSPRSGPRTTPTSGF